MLVVPYPRANKGEWCEFYAHIRIMGQGYIDEADQN